MIAVAGHAAEVFRYFALSEICAVFGVVLVTVLPYRWQEFRAYGWRTHTGKAALSFVTLIVGLMGFAALWIGRIIERDEQHLPLSWESYGVFVVATVALIGACGVVRYTSAKERRFRHLREENGK